MKGGECVKVNHVPKNVITTISAVEGVGSGRLCPSAMIISDIGVQEYLDLSKQYIGEHSECYPYRSLPAPPSSAPPFVTC